MKTLPTLAATLAATLSMAGPYPVSGSVLDFSKLNAVPIGRIDPGMTIGGKPVRLVGTNVTDGACFPADPVDFAKKCRSRGWSWIRFHHFDTILWSDFNRWFSIFYNAVAECNRVGIRVSIDGMSKWGENLPIGIDGVKKGLYRGDPALRTEYASRLTRLFSTPGPDGGTLKDKVWMICLVNEGAHLLGPSDVATTTKAATADTPSTTTASPVSQFYTWSRGVLEKAGYRGLVADMPDGAVNVGTYGPLALDIALGHEYGDDARDTWRSAFWSTLWAAQGWEWGTTLWYLQYAGKSGAVEEWGSLPYNPYRGPNSFFMIGEFQRNNLSSCSFAWASNPESFAGQSKTIDFTNIVSDVPRTVADILCSAVYAYDKRQNATTSWGHMTGSESPNYSYQSDTALIRVTDRTAYALVCVKGTLADPRKLLLFTATETGALGFDSSPISGALRKVETPGSVVALQPPGFRVPIAGGRVTSAYQLSLDGVRLATLTKEDHAVTPLYGCSVVEVNLSESRG